MRWTEYELNVLNTINLYRYHISFSLSEIANMFVETSKCNNRTKNSVRHKLYDLRNMNDKIITLTDDFIPYRILACIKKKPHSLDELSEQFNMPKYFIIKCILYLKANHTPVKINDSEHVVYNSLKIGNIQNIKNSKTTEYVSYPNKYKIKFAIVSDTHLGSSAYNAESLNKFYDLCVDENITTILHAGDLVDGIKIYRGQEFEQDYYGFDSQTDFAIKNYPYRKGIYTYAILGNHDYSFISHSDCDPLRLICNEREDIVYLDKYFGEIILGDFLIALHHPDGGGAYALSYKPQKILETLTEYYDAYIVGHYHSALSLYNYHSLWSCLAGSFQNETMYARRKGLRNVIGGYIVEMERHDTHTVVNPKWIQY